MLNKIALTNVPVFSQRGISRSLLVAAVLGLTMFYQPELNAATPTTVAYLQQIPVSGGRTQTYPIPAVLPGVGVGMYGPFNLPGYG